MTAARLLKPNEQNNIAISIPKDIFVFSHLRWEFVYQRPQHIMSRLSKYYRIFFIEEPIYRDDKTVIHKEISENIHIIQPCIGNDGIADIAIITAMYCGKYNILNPIFWFYSPGFVDVLKYFTPSFVVYDCMDELSAFRGAPVELINKELELLSDADIVFTGGRSLFEAKSKKNKNVYFYPSSVDRKHFASRALFGKDTMPKDLENVKSPIVGFYGVIDERLDTDLLEKVAKLMLEVSFVMIGPIVKISENELPKSENIFYLGPKKYEELPEYLYRFDIAWMPFALNEATRFISPTKTLEYMAAYKPIISTPIKDVVRSYDNPAVIIVKNPIETVEAINYLLAENYSARKMRIYSQNQILEKTSWDETVEAMRSNINQAINTNKVSVSKSDLQKVIGQSDFL